METTSAKYPRKGLITMFSFILAFAMGLSACGGSTDTASNPPPDNGGGNGGGGSGGNGGGGGGGGGGTTGYSVFVRVCVNKKFATDDIMYYQMDDLATMQAGYAVTILNENRGASDGNTVCYDGTVDTKDGRAGDDWVGMGNMGNNHGQYGAWINPWEEGYSCWWNGDRVDNVIIGEKGDFFGHDDGYLHAWFSELIDANANNIAQLNSDGSVKNLYSYINGHNAHGQVTYGLDNLYD